MPDAECGGSARHTAEVYGEPDYWWRHPLSHRGACNQ